MTHGHDTPTELLSAVGEAVGNTIENLRDIELEKHDFSVDAIDSRGFVEFDNIDSWIVLRERVKQAADENDFKLVNKDSTNKLSRNPREVFNFRHETYRANIIVKAYLDGRMETEFDIDYKDKLPRGDDDEQ